MQDRKITTQDFLNVLTIHEIAFVACLKEYVDALCERTSCHIEHDDIYKIDIVNLRNHPEHIHELPLEQRTSLMMASHAADFIANFVIDEKVWVRRQEYPQKNNNKRMTELKLKFLSLSKYYNNVKTDLEKDLVELFDGLFNKILPLLDYNIDNFWLNHYDYFSYFDIKRMRAVTQQLQVVYSLDNYHEGMKDILSSSLGDKEKFMFLNLLRGNIDRSLLDDSRFDECVNHYARNGVGAAALWVVTKCKGHLHDKGAELLADYSMEESIRFIKSLLSDSKNNSNNLVESVFYLISSFVRSNINEMTKPCMENLMTLLRLNARFLTGYDQQLQVVHSLHDVVSALRTTRDKDGDSNLICFIYPLQLIIATLLCSLEKRYDELALQSGVGVLRSDRTYGGYLKLRENYFEIMKAMRLLGEATRTPGNLFYNFFQPEILQRAAVASGDVGECRVDEVLEYTKKHFYIPV